MEYAFNYAYNRDDLHFSESFAGMPAPEAVVIENRFGTFRFEPEQMLSMPQGLIGFGQYRRFALGTLPGDGAANNFRLLQSLDEASLSFIVWPTTASDALIAAEDVDSLLAEFSINREALVLLHIITIREDQPGQLSMTLNVKAPVVVDATSRTALQHVIAGDTYSVRQPLHLGA
jgi:flagellar assembly factor FliW